MRRINLYIILFLVLVLVVYLLFLDALAKPIFERQATEMYGAEVSVDSLSLKPFLGKATLYDLQVADRRDAMRNLVEAERVYVDIDMIRLVENVVDVSEMEVDGLLSFSPRTTPARILRPLVAEGSGIARVGLPDFEIPDVDRLVDQQRDALMGELEQLKANFAGNQEKWRSRLDEIPKEDEIKSYRSRIKKLKEVEKPLEAVSALKEMQTIYAEVNGEIERLRSMQQEFRGDLQMLREQIDLASKLPGKYTRRLVESLGLSSEQIAQLGRQLLRGDLDGLLQQVLAPLAFNTSGGASSQEDAMPIFIRRASLNGSLLPSAVGLSVNGELTNFAWPLEQADAVALLKLTGSAVTGGALKIDANVDHRSKPEDRVKVEIADLPLKNMALAGTEELAIKLLQTLVAVTGELSVSDGKLDGGFTNRFTDTVFDTTLKENAGRAARLIARVLASSNEYMMRIGFGGTLAEPRLNFASDMDKIFQSAIEGAIQEGVAQLTVDLQQKISREVGPEIAAARQQFKALETLQDELQKNLGQLNTLAQQKSRR
jgi:hypothetical protein